VTTADEAQVLYKPYEVVAPVEVKVVARSKVLVSVVDPVEARSSIPEAPRVLVVLDMVTFSLPARVKSKSVLTVVVPLRVRVPSKVVAPSTSRVPVMYVSSPFRDTPGVPAPTFKLPVNTFTNPVVAAGVKVMSPAVVVDNASAWELAAVIESDPPAGPVTEAPPLASTKVRSPTDETCRLSVPSPTSNRAEGEVSPIPTLPALKIAA